MSINKKYHPTQKRLNEARKQGDVLRGRELSTTVSLVVGLTWLSYLSEPIDNISLFFDYSFSNLEDFHSNNVLVWPTKSLSAALNLIVRLCGPFFLILFFTVLLIGGVLTGFNLSFKPLIFNWSRTNLFAGLRRIIACDSGVNTSVLEFIKLIVVTLLYFLLTGSIFVDLLPDILISDYHYTADIYQAVYWALKMNYIYILGFFLLSSFIYLLIDRNRRVARLRMDSEEMKKEFRESQGNPESIYARKILHQEILTQNTLNEVRKAKIVIMGTGKQ